jgi:hypothetical protein
MSRKAARLQGMADVAHLRGELYKLGQVDCFTEGLLRLSSETGSSAILLNRYPILIILAKGNKGG